MIFYFILGILFIDCLLPILEGATGCICTRLEQYKAKHAVQINEYNMQIENVTAPSQAIGFHFESTPEEDFEGEYND